MPLLELRGLGNGAYRIEDYVEELDIPGAVEGPVATLEVSFENSLLLRAVPAD